MELSRPLLGWDEDCLLLFLGWHPLLSDFGGGILRYDERSSVTILRLAVFAFNMLLLSYLMCGFR